MAKVLTINPAAYSMLSLEDLLCHVDDFYQTFEPEPCGTQNYLVVRKVDQWRSLGSGPILLG